MNRSGRRPLGGGAAPPPNAPPVAAVGASAPSTPLAPRVPTGTSTLFIRSLPQSARGSVSSAAGRTGSTVGLAGGYSAGAAVIASSVAASSGGQFSTTTPARAVARSPSASGAVKASSAAERSSISNAHQKSGGTVVHSRSADHIASERFILEGVLSPAREKALSSFHHSSPAVNTSHATTGGYIYTATATAAGPNSAAGTMEGWRSYVLDLETALRELPLLSAGAGAGVGTSSTAAGGGDGLSVGPADAPTAARVRKAFALFESLARASPNIATVLRLFRHEFARAIYEPLSAGGKGAEKGAAASSVFTTSDPADGEGEEGLVKSEGEGDDGADEDGTNVIVRTPRRWTGKGKGGTSNRSNTNRKGKTADAAASVIPPMGAPYFDLVSLLRREKAILATELDVIEAESSVEDLKKQVLRLQALIPFYEHEMERLGREAASAAEELATVKAAADAAAVQHQSALSLLDDECQVLTRENRELEAQLHSLRRGGGGGGGASGGADGSDGGGADSGALTTAYSQLKSEKMAALAHMFEAGGQEASLLLLSHQLEAALNAVLAEAEGSYQRCGRGGGGSGSAGGGIGGSYSLAAADAEAHTVRAKLARDAALLLEEMHEVEEQRSRLLVRTAAASDAESGGGVGAGVPLPLHRALPQFPQQQQQQRKPKQQSPRPRSSVIVGTSHNTSAVDGGDQAVASQISLVRVSAPARMAALGIGAFAGVGVGNETHSASEVAPLAICGVVTNSASTNADHLSTPPFAEGGRAAWIANAFPSLAPLSSAGQQVATATGAEVGGVGGRLLPPASAALQNVFNCAHADPSLVFSRRVTAPLADVSATKFMTCVEVHATTSAAVAGSGGGGGGGGRGAESSVYVQTVPYLDPSHSIALPPRTTHVRLKFAHPMRRDVRVKFGQHSAVDPMGFAAYRGGGRKQRKENADGKANGGRDSPTTATNTSTRPGAADIPRPAYIQGNIADRSDVMAWLHSRASEDASATGGDSATATSAQQQPPHALSPMEGPHWGAYKEVFGSFRPFLPRLLSLEYIDSLMLRAFGRLSRRVAARYDRCTDTAAGRTASAQTAALYAERLFREQYDSRDAQTALLEALEFLYVYPELVAKAAFEVLASLETHAAAANAAAALGGEGAVVTTSSTGSRRAHRGGRYDHAGTSAGEESSGSAESSLPLPVSPHAGVYLRCLGALAPPAEAHLIAAFMQRIAACWPGASTDAGDRLDEREVPMFVKLLYSGDGGAGGAGQAALTLALDGLVGDLVASAGSGGSGLTRAAVRRYFAEGISDMREHTVAAQAALLAAKSAAIQWSELDFEDFLDVCRSGGGGLSSVAAGGEAAQQQLYGRFLYACCVLDKASRMPQREVAFVAVLAAREQQQQQQQGGYKR